MTGTRHIGAHLVLDVHDPIQAFLQIAVSGAAEGQLSETLEITSDGAAVEFTELDTPEGRVHVLEAAKGRLEVTYQATLAGPVVTPAVTKAESIAFLRPSRYAE